MPAKARNLYLRGATYWGRIKVAGTEYRGSLRTDNPREAARRLKAWRTKLEREALGDFEAPTFKEAVVRWSREVLPESVKEGVARRYLSSIAQLDTVFGNLRMDQITSQRVAEYIAGRTGFVTNATIRRDLTALSRLLAACVAWGWREDNPALRFDRSIIRERRDPIRPPDPAAVARVIAAAPVGMGNLLRLLDQTGMRENEAVQLEGEDLDRKGRQIMLLVTKTSRPRVLAWRTPGGDAGPVLEAAPKRGVLFRAETGSAYRNFSSNFARVIGAVAEAEELAGRPFRRFRVHDLRHGFAIRALKAGWSIYALSRHLGHASVKTTEVYLAYLTEEERDRVAQMGAHVRAQIED